MQQSVAHLQLEDEISGGSLLILDFLFGMRNKVEKGVTQRANEGEMRRVHAAPLVPMNLEAK